MVTRLPRILLALALVAWFFSGSGLLQLETAEGQVPDEGIVFVIDHDFSCNVPQSIRTSDFDGDGDLDLVVNGLNRVDLFHGDGRGHFGAPSNQPTGLRTMFLRVADLDGNTLPDVAAWNQGTDDISILLNDGAGGFETELRIDGGEAVRRFDIGNFNADGHPDLVIPNRNSAAVAICDGDGSGGFGTPRLYPTASYPKCALAADFNGDTHLDVAVACNVLSILLGNGAGELGAPTSFPAGLDPASLAKGDFNEDGYVDLVVGQGDGDALVLLGDGSGGFTEIQELEATSTFKSPGIGVEDLDGDGHLDLAVAVVASEVHIYERLVIHRGLGDGTFSLEMILEFSDELGTPNLTIGDFLEDGQPDVAIGSTEQQKVFIALNHTNGHPDLVRCARGTVNSGVKPVADVLLVNGVAGGETRTVEIPEGEPIQCSMEMPPAEGTGLFVVHADLLEPTLETVTELPRSIGATCAPFLLTDGATPAAVWNGVGRRWQLGFSTYFDGSSIPDPDPAPTVFLDLPAGDLTFLPAGTVVTLQGVILDPGSASEKPASATNAVIVKIL